VHRPTAQNSAFVHQLLAHLEQRSFASAPKYLGLDSSGREILSYVPGDVPTELGYFSADQVTAAAHLLCELHDATVDFEHFRGWLVDGLHVFLLRG
jgi:Ser/Thr protein kinase RdoA (MazF antagonist)